MNINFTNVTLPSVFLNNQASMGKQKENGNQSVIQSTNDTAEISKDGFSKFKLQISDNEWRKHLEDQHAQNQKDWETSGAVIQNVEKRIIPNIQLNDKLVNSLNQSSEEIVNAAHSIINDNLLNRDGSVSNEERMELMSLGMEKAKYLSEHHMTKEKAAEFMSAMETIAKIGVNGGTLQNGIIKYDIPQGPLVGAPENNINEFDVMKTTDSSAWNKYSAMMDDAVKSGDQVKMISAMKYALDWSKNSHKMNPGIFETQQKNYSDWKISVENVEVSNTFYSVNRTSKESFLSNAATLGKVIDQGKLETDLKKFFSHFEKVNSIG